MEDIWKRRKRAFLVGGSGLYIRAALNGIFKGPGRNGDVRQRLEKEAEEFGSASLYERLRDIDLECAMKIHPNDTRRIVRALEVYELTNKKMSEWQKKTTKTFKVLKVCLYQDMKTLYQRIELRVDEMIEKGLVEEVTGLVENGYGKSPVVLDTIGYSEILKYLRGNLTLAEAKEELKKNSRRFAKRQMTWFRGERDMKWIEVKEGQTQETILANIEKAFGLMK
jgi:tRNA dimethylallyltransferase